MTSPNVLVQTSFAQAAFQPQEFAKDFKAHLFARDPSFVTTFAMQGVARDPELLDMLAAAVDALSDPARLSVMARQLAVRHGHARIQPRQYGVIGQALLDTLAQRLGPAFTDAVRSAWADAYVRIAEAIMAARYNTMDLVA